MSKHTITKNTTVGQIKAWVADDFGRSIDTDTAQAIKDAHKHGALVWSATRLTTTDSSNINISAAQDSTPRWAR